MDPIFDFAEITFLKEGNHISGSLREKEFYEWLQNNSKDTIISILSLKYKADGMDYSFRVERTRIPTLNKWDAICIFPKSESQPVQFTFEWKRGLDIRLDFERKFKEELEKRNVNMNCVCKQQNRYKEMAIGDNAVSNF